MFFDPIAQDNREDPVPGVAAVGSGSPVPVPPATSTAPLDVVGSGGVEAAAGAAGAAVGGLAARLEVLVAQFDALADDVLADGGSDRVAAVLVPLIARLERRAAALGVVVGGRAVASKRREVGGDRVAAEWLSQQTSGSRRDAEGAFELLEGFASHGSVRGAFEAGDLTRSQAELVLAAAVADPGCEDEMLALAGRAPVEDLARESRKRVRAARRETLEERERRHRGNRRLWMVTDDDGAFVGGFSTDTMTGAVLKGGVELWTEAMFRRDRRLGVRNKNSARQMDALIAMSQIATGATPAGLGFELCDLPAALRPREGDWIGDPPPSAGPHADGPGPGGAGDGSRVHAGGSGPGCRPSSTGGDSVPPDDGEALPSPGADPPGSGGGASPDAGPGTKVRYRARGPASPVINVHVDVGPLRRGHLLPGEHCEIEGVGPVSITAVRDLVGDSLLKFILEEGRDVYNTAHARRSMTAHQKTAVLAMYQECCVAGCGSRVGLQDDHQVPWAKTRHTWAPGMHPICPHHHDRKTHHRWDFVPEPPDPVTGHLRLVPPEHPDHPDNTGAPRPMPPGTDARAPSGP